MRAPDVIVAALAPGWALLVVAGALLVRPEHSRVSALRPAPGGGAADRSDAERSAAAVLARVGMLAARAAALVARRPPPDLSLTAARRLGTTLVAAAGLAPFSLRAAGLAAVSALVAPPVLARRAERRRLDAIEADLPEVVDLLGLALGAGLNVSLAVAAVGRRGAGPLAGELARCAEEATRGRRLADALDDVASRTTDAVRPLVAALVAGERYGAPLGVGFERLAAETRADQRRRCETAARRVPVTLLFPLVVCILPAFALLTVAPLIASGLGSLSL